MNKAILMGRLVKDPDVRYSQSATPVAVAKYTLAVNRRFKKDGEPDADFINCVAFGKTAEFAEKYYKKGQLVSVVGRIQVKSWDDKEGQKRWSTDVIIEDQYFAESKGQGKPKEQQEDAPGINKEGFYPIDEDVDPEDLPF